MTLYPGRRFIGDTVRLAVNWQNEDGIDLDPSTNVQAKTRAPDGTTVTYSYVSSEIVKEETGDYYVEITPDQSGRWFFRWIATGVGTNKVIEGSFVIQASMFFDDPPTDYGRG